MANSYKQLFGKILLLFCIVHSRCDSFTFENPIRFPYGNPFMGIFLALAIPLDLPEMDVFVSYNFEAAYVLPENQTRFTYPPILTDTGVIQRSMDRNFVYKILEYKLQDTGYPGKDCLLRTICEAAKYSTQHTGILGDIFHIILTPSSSVNVGLPKDYLKAEKQGEKNQCGKYSNKCPYSLLGLISWVDKII